MGADSDTRRSSLLRGMGYVVSVLLAGFGAWWASFSGFLMPSQMHLYVSFSYWLGIGMVTLGALFFGSVLLLPRPYAWLPPALAATGLLALQLARLAVFGSYYLNTDWWVVFGAVMLAALCAFLAVRSRSEGRPA